LITFVILFLTVRKFAFAPIQNMVDKRRNEIATSIQHAEDMKTEADRLLAEYRETMTQAKLEAEEIIERGRKVGEDQKAGIVGEAKSQAQKEVENAREQIQREARKAVQEIKDQVADLTVLAAGKVAGKTLNKEDHLRLVDEAMSEADFDQLGAGGA
jgi:F-type H+-transporting ATPase subunit b